jgi:UPF0755 protein
MKLKKIILPVVVIALSLGGYFANKVYSSQTSFEGKRKYIYIKSNDANIDAVINSLKKDSMLKDEGTFSMLASKMNYADKVKPGRYEILNGASAISIIRSLRSGNQTPINFTINPRVKTLYQLANKIASNFECDSATAIQYLLNASNFVAYGLDTNTLMTAVIPNTYSMNWTLTPEKIISKLHAESKAFWQVEGRTQKAEALGLDPVKAYTLASIVEEETNREADRGNIASVYLNRLKKGMMLQADPTVKFAMRDFGLRRILNVHLQYPSPFNTYRNVGLPPGPICSVSPKTIDAVLNAPQTEYIFFVASPTFDGSSVFTTNLADHNKAAKEYQAALTIYLRKKAEDAKAKEAVQ